MALDKELADKLNKLEDEVLELKGEVREKVVKNPLVSLGLAFASGVVFTVLLTLFF